MQQELSFVLKQLADEKGPVRAHNLAVLSDLPRDRAAEFREAWVAFTPARRLELTAAMVEQAEENIHLNFHTILRECLIDTDPRVRRLAIEGLWEDERSSLVKPLTTLLSEDPALEVRAAAASSLGRFLLLHALGELAEGPATAAEEALRTAWFRPHEVIEVRRRALEGLAYSSSEGISDLIGNAYYDEDELMRQSAVFAMGRSAEPRWARFVLAEFGSHEPAMRFEAATAAGELGLNVAVRPLIYLLDDADSNVREAAALSLGKIGGREARRALEACMQSGDERLAQAAEEALDELSFNSGAPDEPLIAYGADADELDDEDELEFSEEINEYDASDAGDGTELEDEFAASREEEGWDWTGQDEDELGDAEDLEDEEQD